MNNLSRLAVGKPYCGDGKQNTLVCGLGIKGLTFWTIRADKHLIELKKQAGFAELLRGPQAR